MNLILEMMLSEDIQRLLNNKQDMDNLYHAKKTENVLDILKRYGYKGNSEDLDRDIFEISEVSEISDCELDKAVGGKRRVTPIVLASALALTSIGFESPAKAKVTVSENVDNSVSNTFKKKITKAFKSAKEKIVKPDKENILSVGIGATFATLFTSLVFGTKISSKNKTIKNLNDKLSGEKPRDADSLEGTEQLKEKLEEAVKTQKQLELELENARKTNTQIQNQLENVETAIQNDIYNPVEIVKGRHVHMDDQGVPEGWDDWYQKKQTEQRDTSRIPQGIVAKRVDLLEARPHGEKIPQEMYFDLQPFEYAYYPPTAEDYKQQIETRGFVYARPEYNKNYEKIRSTPFSNLDTLQDSVEDLYACFVDNKNEEKYLAEIEEALTKFVSSEEWTHIKADFYQMINSMPKGHQKTFAEPYLLPLQYWLLKFTSLSSRDENYQNVYRLYFGYGKKPYAALSSILDILHSLSYTYHTQIDEHLEILNKSLTYLRTKLKTSENFGKINEFFDLAESAGKRLEFLSNY